VSSAGGRRAGARSADEPAAVGATDPGALVVVHASPGRVRLKATDGRNGAGLTRAEAAVKDVAWIREARRVPLAESLVVTFDPAEGQVGDVLRALEEGGIRLASAPEPDAQSRGGSNLGDGIADAFLRADRRVAEMTRGGADLRTLVPIGLAALAAREIVAILLVVAASAGAARGATLAPRDV
jgi:hypothetical protein